MEAERESPLNVIINKHSISLAEALVLLVEMEGYLVYLFSDVCEPPVMLVQALQNLIVSWRFPINCSLKESNSLLLNDS